MTIVKGTIHILTEKGSGNTPNKYSNLYPKTSADQVTDLDTAIEDKVTSMISYDATKTSGSGIGVLDTVPSTFDGGLWYEMTDNVSKLWLRNGNYGYRYSHDRIRFFGNTSENLIAYLPFTSTLDDILGNEWTISDAPPQIVDSTLYFNGSSYLVNETISAAIANSPWTIDFWATPSDTARDRFFFSTFNANYGTAGMVTKGWVHMNWHSGNIDYGSYGDDHDLNLGLAPNVRHHFALVYDGIEKFVFVDGVLKGSYVENIKLGGKFFIGVAPASDIGTFTGTIDHFRIFKGVALWTQNFTPPTASDYPDFNPSTSSNTIQSGSSGNSINYIIGSNVSTVEGGFWRDIINDTPVLKLRHGDYEYNFQYDSLIRVSDNDTAVATVTPDTYVLGTASVSSEGGVWYEVNDSVPTLKLHAGNYNYGFKYDSITYKGDNSHLAAYLPFNVSATADACSNVWTVTGSPQIVDSKLYLSSTSYLTNTTIADSIGSLPWTADCWFSCRDTNNTSLLQRFQLSGGNTSHSMVSSCISGNIFMIHLGDANLVSNVAVTANTRYHCALTYDGTTLRMFINGVLIVQNELAIQLGGSSYIGWPSADITIDHLRVFKGQALWTSDFTSPTVADYA